MFDSDTSRGNRGATYTREKVDDVPFQSAERYTLKVDYLSLSSSPSPSLRASFPSAWYLCIFSKRRVGRVTDGVRRGENVMHHRPAADRV